MQELRLRQQMTLAPRLQQSVKLLQMSALEFTTAVELALASNPFLEEAEEQAAGPADIAEGRPDMDSANPAVSRPRRRRRPRPGSMGQRTGLDAGKAVAGVGQLPAGRA
jgi:DNA-directed RNA polymerase specialized sigma54-like protein